MKIEFGGVGLLIFIVFLILKLTKVIDWSWWWITAPLWIPFLLLMAIVAIANKIFKGTWV